MIKSQDLENKVVSITGTLENLTRKEVFFRLRKIGAIPVSSLVKEIDILVIGHRPSQMKKKQAERREVLIMDEDEFLKVLGVSRTHRIPGL